MTKEMESSAPARLTWAEWGAGLRKLVCATDAQEIAALEALTGYSQQHAVDHYIEGSCWGEDLPQYEGGKGTPGERREALVALLRRHGREEA
jgi:hypothetical protein